MIQTLSGIALLCIFTIPVIILILSLYQNLIESVNHKRVDRKVTRKAYMGNTEKNPETKLRVVK